jgi:hypothetical protein
MLVISIDIRQPARTFEKFRPGTPRSCEGALHLAPGKTLEVTAEEAKALKAAGILFQQHTVPAPAPAPVVVPEVVPNTPPPAPAPVVNEGGGAPAAFSGRRTKKPEPESAS